MNLLIYVAGWTLIHFVWQGAAIAAAALAALRLVPATSARLRYAIASTALAVMLAAPAATTGWLLSLSSARSLTDVAGAAAVAVGPGAVAPTPAGSGAGINLQSPALDNPTLLTTVVGVWLTGVLVCLPRLSGGWWRVSRMHRASLSMRSSDWQQATLRLAASMGVRRTVRTVESALVATPTVLGWLRPVILLPAAALVNLSPVQLEAILAHELAHVRRHDYAINLLQAAAETLLFYHPAVWWVSQIIRVEREHCCDDVAVNVCGNPVAYAEALEELETWRGSRPALAMSATGGRLLQRVRRVLRVPADDHRPTANLPAISALVLVLILIFGAVQRLPARVEEIAQPGQTPVAPSSPNALPAGWQIAKTEHFDIAYPSQVAGDVERVGREAEAAYAQLRLDLRHEPAFQVPLVLFPTRADMERAVAAGFSIGGTQHVFLPVDTPPSRLRGELVHEVTHVFALDIIPVTGRTDLPPWIHEGLADFERGEWEPADAAALQKMVRTGAFPRLSDIAGTSADSHLSRIVGHAAFDYIVARAGKDGMRRFLMAVRQAPVGGVDSAYQLTFGTSAAEFDRSVEEFVRARFQQ
jgi:beta-lactamase regulating signal transducer with metallopeptidase domain